MRSLKPVLKGWGHGHWLALFVLPLSALFFVGGPGGTALPFMRHMWNLGHIAFFFSATIAWLHFRPAHSKGRFFVDLAAVLIVSFAIEVLQRSIGRDFSTMDILRNLTGSVFGALLVSRKQVHITLTSFFSLVLLLDVGGFLFKLHTDYTLQTQAPIIDNFENFATLSYWNSEIDYAPEPVLEGEFSGQADLQPTKYAGVNMSPVMLNWSGYRALQVNIYSPRDLEETFVIRIHDRAHENAEQRYDDRFNRQYNLRQGWNRFEISLRDLKNAPANRDMDLTKIAAIGLFIVDLEQPITLYLDDFHLVE